MNFKGSCFNSIKSWQFLGSELLNHITFLLSGNWEGFPCAALPGAPMIPGEPMASPALSPRRAAQGLGLQRCCTAGVDSRFLGKEPLKKLTRWVFFKTPQTNAFTRQREILVSVLLISPPEDAPAGPAQFLSGSRSHWDRPRSESGWSQRWVTTVMLHQSCTSTGHRLTGRALVEIRTSVAGLFLVFYCEISNQWF